MSRYLKIETEFNDQEMFKAALEAVCEQRGIPFEVHNEPDHLYGYQGDRRRETAHYIVRRKHVGQSTNDLGFRREADGAITAVISEFDNTSSGWGGRGIDIVHHVKREYARAKITQMANRRGLEVVEIEDNGVIRLTLRPKAASSRRTTARVSVRRG